VNLDLVLAEWHRGLESLEAARILTDEGLYADSISRDYYAVLHLAKSALLVHGIETESHSSVRRLFGYHLVQSNEIERDWAVCLAECLDNRLAADYDSEFIFSEEEGLLSYRRAKDFQKRIHQYLTSKGINPALMKKRKK